MVTQPTPLPRLHRDPDPHPCPADPVAARSAARPVPTGTRRPPAPGAGPAPAPHDPEPRLDGVRVAMINWRDPWQSVAGGAETYAWQISRHLADRGADVVFVTSRERGQPRAETRDGIAVRRMGGPFTVYPLVMLWLLLRRRRLHAAFDCMNGIPFFSRLVLPRRTPVVSIVHHVHDLQFNAYFSRPLAWLGRFVESRVASRVYASCPTVTVSESSRRAMREKLRWRAPITVIHNGGPGQPASPPARPDLGDPAIVSLGRLVVQKRVTRIVDAAAELRTRHPGLRVHVVGRGPESTPWPSASTTTACTASSTCTASCPKRTRTRSWPARPCTSPPPSSRAGGSPSSKPQPTACPPSPTTWTTCATRCATAGPAGWSATARPSPR